MGAILLEQALRNAIESEDAAERFYALLADSTEDRRTKDFLLAMAKEEAAHKRQIETLAAQVASRSLPDLPDGKVELVETRSEWSDLDKLDFGSALAMAIEAEDFAALFYDALAASFESEKEKAVFSSIARTEERHAQRLREMK